jgi:cleavage and polyadenylation specificity factor subunit 1
LLYLIIITARESVGGQRLLRKADFNVGSNIHSMFRVLCRNDPAVDKRAYNADRKHITYFYQVIASQTSTNFNRIT